MYFFISIILFTYGIYESFKLKSNKENPKPFWIKEHESELRSIFNRILSCENIEDLNIAYEDALRHLPM